MAEIFEFKIKGLDTLQKKLEAIPKDLSKKVMKQALMAGADVVQDAIVQEAPEYDGSDEKIPVGFLKEHFGKRLKLSNKEIAGSVFIGPEGKMDYPNREGGYTKKQNKKGRTYKVGRVHVASVARWLEFGTKWLRSKNPFMTRGFEKSRNQALEVITEKLREGLDQVAK